MEQYIPKSALVAEIEKLKEEIESQDSAAYTEAYIIGVKHTLKTVSDILDTLEVKKVNLDDDYIEEVYSHIDSIKDTADKMTSGNFMHHKAAIKFSANTIAKVLELIGLKAQKGEE